MKANRQWVPITEVENIPLREGRAVNIAGREIAVFRLEDRCLAVENACPHKGGPLCDGIVSGSTVICPLHGRRFDLESGMAVRASEPANVATFPTLVKAGIIYLDASSLTRSDEHAA